MLCGIALCASVEDRLNDKSLIVSTFVRAYTIACTLLKLRLLQFNSTRLFSKYLQLIKRLTYKV